MKLNRLEIERLMRVERQRLVAEMAVMTRRMRVIEARLSELDKAEALLEGME